MAAQPDTYSYSQVAARIADEFGVRPSLSAIRSEISRRPREVSDRRPRVTAGVPEPLRPAGGPPNAGARFSAAEVDRWLAQHPLRQWLVDRDRAFQDFARGREPAEVVAEGLQSGLSWRTLAEAYNASRHHPADRITVAGFHKRYRHVGTIGR